MATAIASRQAVERDILWVTVTCVVVVALSILLYFRRWRAIPLIGVPAVMGTVMAFAVAELAFGYVNSSTAFLGSIILGNGINYAIILMSRYQEQRAAGDDPELALERAVGGVLAGHRRGGDLRLGRLRLADADQLPRLLPVRGDGRGGVLFCWLATFTVLPAMFVVGDRRAPGRARPRSAPLSLARSAGCCAPAAGAAAGLGRW